MANSTTPPVEHRQHPGHAQADRADVGVGRRPKSVEQPQKILVLVLQLRVDLEPDDGFKIHSLSHQLSEITFNYEMREIRERV